MSKVVSLRRARKTRARDGERREADARAARHGLSKAEREAEGARAEKAARDLDGHQRE